MATRCKLLVEPVPGEVLRFRVSSRQPSVPPYLVDLGAYKGNGQCDCKDFQCRHQPKLERGAAPHPSRRCFHVKLARAYLCNAFIASCMKLNRSMG